MNGLLSATTGITRQGGQGGQVILQIFCHNKADAMLFEETVHFKARGIPQEAPHLVESQHRADNPLAPSFCTHDVGYPPTAVADAGQYRQGPQ